MLWAKRRGKRKRRNKPVIIYSLGILLIVSWVLLALFRSKESRLISPVPSQRVISESIVQDRKDKQQEVENLLQGANISFSTVTSSQSSIKINLDNGAEVLLSEEEDISEQVSSLQGILSRLTMEGKKFVLLDLRFSKPIIQFE